MLELISKIVFHRKETFSPHSALEICKFSSYSSLGNFWFDICPYGRIFHSKSYELFPLFVIAITFLFATAMSGSCMILSTIANDIVPILNEFLSFTNKLNRPQVHKNRPNKNRIEGKTFENLVNVCFDDDQFDSAGIISINLCFTIIPVVLIPIILYVNMDLTFYFFFYISSYQSRSVVLNITCFVLRFIIACLCIPEANLMFRNLALIFLFMTTLRNKCIWCLSANLKPFIKGYQALRTLFIIANQFCSLICSLYLGVLLFLIIICGTVSVLAVGKVHWSLYVFFHLLEALL